MSQEVPQTPPKRNGRSLAWPLPSVWYIPLNDPHYVLLNVGQAHGVKSGDYFTLYAPASPAVPLGRVRVTRVYATDAWAKCEPPLTTGQISEGDTAVFLEQDEETQRQRVRHLAQAAPNPAWLAAAWVGWQQNPDPNPDTWQPLAVEAGLPTVMPDVVAILRIGNHAGRDLNLTVFGLLADGSMRQLFPPPAQAASWPLPPQAEKLLFLPTTLAADQDDCVETVLIWGATALTDFRWLQRPSENQVIPTQAFPPPSSPDNSRSAITELVVRRTWTATQTALRIVRPQDT